MKYLQKFIVLMSAMALTALSLPDALFAHGSASLPPAGSPHFRAPFDHEQYRRDHPHPAAKRLADLNVGEPRTVRMIYFRPKDSPFRQEVVDAMKEVLHRTQTFYAEEMQRHGHGYRTFRFETDTGGEPVVHQVVSRHPEDSYVNNQHLQSFAINEEINLVFDSSKNILFIVGDVSNWGDAAIPGGKNGGKALYSARTVLEAKRAWHPGKYHFYVIVHELGHAFGLDHDWRDGAYIMSYGPAGWDRLSACAAEFLSVNPYFNYDVPTEDTPAPAVELISSRGYPTGSTSVSVQLNVRDSDGIHQVILLAQKGLKACQKMNGERVAVVEFDYDGVVPTGPSQTTGLSNPPVHPIVVKAVDNGGNVGQTSFALFDVSTQRNLTATLEVWDAVQTVAFSPDGTTLALGGYPLELWDVSDWSKIGTFRSPSEWDVQTVAFSPDGRTLAVGGIALKLWDVAKHAEIATLEGHTGRIYALAFSPDGTTIASVGRDATVRLWDVAKQTEIAALEGHRSAITTVAFSPDGRTLASGGSVLKLWDVAKQTDITTLRALIWFFSVAFSPDGTTLALGGFTLKLWDVAKHAEIATLEGHTSRIYALAFSPDGTTIASGGEDATVRLWDVATRRNIATFSGGVAAEVKAVAFSPDGTTLASGWDNGKVLLWDVSEWTGPRPFVVEAVSGGGQQGTPGSALAQPMVVRVLDQNGVPVSGATVTFAVTEGGGTLSATTATTDANGRVSTTMTLGRQPGTNTVVATVSDIDPATFTATATTCPGDFDGNGRVDIADFLAFGDVFGSSSSDANYNILMDFDSNGRVDIADFLNFIEVFGSTCES